MEKFLSCDWGTSSFRLRLVDALSRAVLEEVISAQGIADTYRDWLASDKPNSERAGLYKAVLSSAIHKMRSAPESGIPIILSGMASSSVGMQELPYRNFPFTWDPLELTMKKFEADGQLEHPVYLVSGFRTETDIMRGEETMLLGCDLNQVAERILIFPGTHSKHVIVQDGIATDFRTYTTGEVFNLLVQKSILSNSVVKGEDPESFDLGVKNALTSNLLHAIFMVRTRQLLNDTSPISNFQYLSGLLIGTELKELQGTTALVSVVSEEPLTNVYRRGLDLLGLRGEITSVRARDAFINGHCIVAKAYI